MNRLQRLPSADVHPVLIHPLIKKSKVPDYIDVQEQYKNVKDEGDQFLDPLGAASPLSFEMTFTVPLKVFTLKWQKLIYEFYNNFL
jgi:hypothetical protein